MSTLLDRLVERAVAPVAALRPPATPWVSRPGDGVIEEERVEVVAPRVAAPAPRLVLPSVQRADPSALLPESEAVPPRSEPVRADAQASAPVRVIESRMVTERVVEREHRIYPALERHTAPEVRPPAPAVRAGVAASPPRELPVRDAAPALRHLAAPVALPPPPIRSAETAAEPPPRRVEIVVDEVRIVATRPPPAPAARPRPAAPSSPRVSLDQYLANRKRP